MSGAATVKNHGIKQAMIEVANSHIESAIVDLVMALRIQTTRLEKIAIIASAGRHMEAAAQILNGQLPWPPREGE
jgi:hypothetical protein